MNTLWHIFWTYVLFRKRKYYWKTLIFAFIPDMTTLAIFAISLMVNGADWSSFHTMFTQYYKGLLIIPSFFHSLVVVTLVAIIIWLTRWKSAWPFIYGWTFHVILDAATHANDSLPIFWPLSSYVFKSAFSYWEIGRFAAEVNILNMVLASIAIVMMAKDSVNKRFEAWFMAFIFIGSIAIFLFLYAAHELKSASFIAANVIAVGAIIYFLAKHRTVLIAKHL